MKVLSRVNIWARAANYREQAKALRQEELEKLQGDRVEDGGGDGRGREALWGRFLEDLTGHQAFPLSEMGNC